MTFNTHDQVTDSPTNTFATLNPLIHDLGGTSVTLSNGNLNFDASNNPEVYFTFNADNYYFEVIDNISGNNFSLLILSSNEPKIGSTEYYNITNHSRIYYTGVIDNRGSANLTVSSGSLFSIASGDVISVHKKDKSTLILKKVATSANVEINISGLSDDFIIGLISYTSTRSTSYSLNFGADSSFGGAKSGSANATDANGIGSFYYQPPTGALALCSANLRDPIINPTENLSAEDFFKAVEYPGTGSQGDYPVVTGMQPDLVWIKCRNVGHQHYLVDSVRGVNHALSSSWSTNSMTPIEFTSFNTNGFTAKFTSGGGRTAYSSDGPFVAWTWKAGGAPSGSNIYMKDGTGYTDTSNTALFGNASNYNITPIKASIGTKQGFGIYKFTASSVNGVANTKLPHGLGKAPEFVIIKSTDTANTNWVVTLPALGDDLYLNSTGARINGSSAGTYFQTTADSNVITFGRTDTTYSNKPNLEYIVYAFTSVKGYSAFGSYTGNGSPDGPFVYIGFKPSFFLVKCTNTSSATDDWAILDNARDPHNVVRRKLYPNDTYGENDEATYWGCDFLSNGVKIRNTWEASNQTGKNYIYMAFAEQPGKYSNAR